MTKPLTCTVPAKFGTAAAECIEDDEEIPLSGYRQLGIEPWNCERCGRRIELQGPSERHPGGKICVSLAVASTGAAGSTSGRSRYLRLVATSIAPCA